MRLTLPPSLAATWLIPRLSTLEANAADVDVQLVLTTRLIDLRRDQVDIAIRYGRGAWPDVDATLLFEDMATPLGAPGLVPDGTSFDRLPADLRLIGNKSIPDEWEEWVRARGYPPPDTGRMLTLDSIEQVLQIAEAGHSLTMGRSPYIQTRLDKGTLVAPFGVAGPTDAAYYICTPAGSHPRHRHASSHAGFPARPALWIRGLEKN